MCDAYAHHLDEAHSKTLRSLAALAAEVAAMEVAGAALGSITAGAAEAAAQDAVAVRTTVVAAEVSISLGRLAAVVENLASILVEVATGAAAVFASLADFVGNDVSAQSLQAVVLAQKSTLVAQLATAPTWTQGRLPAKHGPPGGMLVKRNPQGEVTNYMVYDSEGLAIKRVDLVGKAHHGVPTPHTMFFEHSRDPSTGEAHARQDPRSTRPVLPEELP